MRKQRKTYALILLAAYILCTAAIISWLGIGFEEMGEWNSVILLVSLFAAVVVVYKYMSESEKLKDESVPRALSYIRQFRFRRYITNDKRKEKSFLEEKAREHRIVYALLAAAMLAFELIPLLIYTGGTDFAALSDKQQILIIVITAEAILFVLFLFPFLPGFIYLISGFETVENNADKAQND